MGHARNDEIPKTNAMRELDRAGVAYEAHAYELDDEVSVGLGLRMTEASGVDPDAAFKTLVCVSPRGAYVVCCVPVACELDLKKAARAAHEKSLDLINWHDLPAVTGYVRGGCSPIGMKKHYPTFIDETACLFERISVSGGKIGVQLTIDTDAFISFCDAELIDLTEE